MDYFNLSSQLQHDANVTVTDPSSPMYRYGKVLIGEVNPAQRCIVWLEWTCYNWVTPLNLLLSLFIVIHNMVIVRFYFLHGTGITQLFFLWIGIADIFAAIGMAVFSISSILFYNDVIDKLSFQRGIFGFVLLFPAALACSRSLNVFVSTIKTINITSIARRGIPVQINKIAVFIVSFATFLLWLTLSTYEEILHWNNTDGPRIIVECQLQDILGISSLVGLNTIIVIFYKFGYYFSSAVFLCGIIITIHYILPSIITFICMIIQAHSIKSSIQQDSNSNQPSASYINMTIFMVTALFCICHMTYSVFALYFLTHSMSKYYLILTSSFEFTLPLLNAALFPVIIILRKQSLRERYRDLSLRVFSVARSGVTVVIRWCGGVVTWVAMAIRWCGGVVTWVARIGRRADYEEVSETP